MGIGLALLTAGYALAQPRPAEGWPQAVRAPEVEQAQARVVVLELTTGKPLVAARLRQAAMTLDTPGSTLKPFVLYHALQTGRWSAGRRVACQRTLRVGTHAMNCAHPPMEPMDAKQALAWSCNTYFAALAGQLRPEELRDALAAQGLLGATGLVAPEGMAEFRLPRTPDELRLTALGVEGVRVTLLELAMAYRRLEMEMEQKPSAAAEVVEAGLRDSASFGMAGAADLGGVSVAGKTGTAESVPGGPTHGWFVGVAPATYPQVVLAVYVPAGHGANAAAVAAAVLERSPLRPR